MQRETINEALLRWARNPAVDPRQYANGLKVVDRCPADTGCQFNGPHWVKYSGKTADDHPFHHLICPKCFCEFYHEIKHAQSEDTKSTSS